MGKAKFAIGDYVLVAYHTSIEYVDQPGEVAGGRSSTIRTIVSIPLATPVYGWIVGARYRYTGTYNCSQSHSNYYDNDNYEQAYLSDRKAVLVWKVAKSLMGTPIECTEGQIKLIDRPIGILGSKCRTFKLGIKWPESGNCWTAADQRKAMREWPRDDRGRWLKVGKK